MAANPRWRKELDSEAKATATPQLHSISGDQEVMSRIAHGDEDAMMLLYERHSGLVYSVALHLLSDPQLAEDVAQEVFLNIWRNPRSFNAARGSLTSWLAVISRHRAIDILRKRRKESEIDADTLCDRKLESHIEQWEAATKISPLLALMPAPQRLALGLAYFCGLSHSEISSRIEEPIGTVKSRIRLALEFLRKALANPKSLKYPLPIDPHRRLKRK